MATTVGSHQVSTITDPADGSSMVASTMRSVSSALRTGVNDHDNDSGLHLQSSVAGSRPAAGTAGRKWLTSDTLLITYDNGVSWADLAYLKSSGGTVTGAVTVSAGGINVTGGITGELATAAQPNVTSLGTLSSVTVSGTATIGTLTLGAAGKILSGATSIAIKDNADSKELFKFTEATGNITIQAGATNGSVSLLARGTGTVQITANSASGVVLGNTSFLTTDTTGFVFLGVVAGTPSGAVADGAFVFDSSANRIWVRLNSTWKYVALT